MFLQKTEAKPAALLGESRTPQKSFLFLLEEKIRRAQMRKSEENFFVGWRVVASGGGLASLVGIRLVKSSDFVQEGQPPRQAQCKTKYILMNKKDLGAFYTPKHTVNYMLGLLSDFDERSKLLEPCGGDGAFVSVILEKKLLKPNQITVWDINPEVKNYKKN